MSDKSYTYQIHEVNIKIISYDASTKQITLVVTDIACSIITFLHRNRGRISQLLLEDKN